MSRGNPTQYQRSGTPTEGATKADDVMDLKKVRESIDELERLCQRKINAAAAFDESCKNVASKACIRPDVLKAFVTARVKDKVDEYERKAEQLGLLFEEYGAD